MRAHAFGLELAFEDSDERVEDSLARQGGVSAARVKSERTPGAAFATTGSLLGAIPLNWNEAEELEPRPKPLLAASNRMIHNVANIKSSDAIRWFLLNLPKSIIAVEFSDR